MFRPVQIHSHLLLFHAFSYYIKNKFPRYRRGVGGVLMAKVLQLYSVFLLGLDL